MVPRDYPMPVAEDWPDLLGIVENRVKPDRIGLKDKTLRERWWRFARTRPELHSAIEGLARVLAISAVAQHASFGFLPTGMVYAHRLIIFPLESYSTFCALQSRLHEIWIRRFSSTLEDSLCYSPTDCFETFPFPRDWSINPRLEAVGKQYYEFRAGLMQRNGEGLTKTYNRFHDPCENDPDIGRLRQLHEEMDRAVLCEYGWDDISVRVEFLCDLNPEEASTSKRFWRYRWPDDVHDEVLGRLIELNAERAQEEHESEETGAPEPMPSPEPPRTSMPAMRTRLDDHPGPGPLFECGKD